MLREFKLPDPGEGVHEAEVVEVLVAPGDQVEEGQSLIVIETDKATSEVPSPFDGAIREVRVKAGDSIRVGDVIAVIEVEGESEAVEPSRAEKEPVAEAEEKAGQKAGPAKPAEKETQPAEEPVKGRKGPVPASPSTRRLARELGVALEDVSPSGPGGRVTAEDVRAFAETGGEPPRAPEPKPAREAPAGIPAPELPDFSQWGPVNRVPLKSVRRATAQHMVTAWAQVPHVTHADVADVTELEAFRQRHKGKLEASGGALTLTIFAIKAAVAALKRFPRFNASIDMEKEEIILKEYYHIGVAVDTERGLLVPVIRNAERKSLTEIAVEFKALAEKTRKGETGREDLSGGTFSITNVGVLGGTGFTPIVNYPQVAILGMARATRMPVVKGEGREMEMVPRLILPLCLGFDHRILDGADAARFLGAVIENLEDPARLMMAM